MLRIHINFLISFCAFLAFMIIDQDDENEALALAPIDASASKGVTNTKQKCKIIVDKAKNIWMKK